MGLGLADLAELVLHQAQLHLEVVGAVAVLVTR